MINELELKLAEGRALQQRLLRNQGAGDDLDAWEIEVASLVPGFLDSPLESYAQGVTMKDGQVESGALYPPDHILSRVHSRILALRRYIAANR